MESKEYPPKNEYELCQSFEDLLFMRIREPLPLELLSRYQEVRVTKEMIGYLDNLGILNRIFRRWYQTTWGWTDWSDHFEGETPRQELAKLYPEINRGEMFLSVKLVLENEEWKIKPSIFSKKFFGQKSLFLYGLEQSKNQKGPLFEPHLEIGFRPFLEWILKNEKIIQKSKLFSLPKSDEERYWLLFWQQAGGNLVFNCKLNLPKVKLLTLSLVFQDCLTEIFASQEEGKDNFLDTDLIFSELWSILRKSDKRLLPLEEITDEGLEKGLATRKDKKFLYSVDVFYHLGIAFDELLLFPLEWYFGGAEIVWTDKMGFVHDLAVILSFIHNELKSPELDKKEGKELDLVRLWSTLPTSFRLIGPIYQYLRSYEKRNYSQNT